MTEEADHWVASMDDRLAAIHAVIDEVDAAEAAELLCHALGSVVQALGGNRNDVVVVLSGRILQMAKRADEIEDALQ